MTCIWSSDTNISSTRLLNAVKSSGKIINATDSYVGFGEIDAEIALTNIGSGDNIETNKTVAYSSDILYSVPDTSTLTSYSIATTNNTAYSLNSNCGCSGDQYTGYNTMETAIPINLSEYNEISY